MIASVKMSVLVKAVAGLIWRGGGGGLATQTSGCEGYLNKKVFEIRKGHRYT